MNEKVGRYAKLTQEELNLKIEEAKKLLCEEENTDLCEELIRYAGISSLAFAELAFEKKILYPAILYNDAPEYIRDALIEMLDSEEIDKSLRVNHILMILATIGGDKVCEAFKRWEVHPKKWRGNLYVGPSDYALEGNWTINAQGQKEELTFSTCYGLEERETYDRRDVLFGEVTREKCTNCQGSFMNLLTIDGRDERLAFLGVHGKINIKSCLKCLPWAEWIFCKYEEDGESEVIPFISESDNGLDDEELQKMIDRHPIVLTEEPMPQDYCAQVEGSAIGGKPQWINDAQYAECPECGKRMKHLAQLGSEHIEFDGTIYVQICTDCHIAATCYQQS